MARIRTIKPEFWCDEKLSPLSAVDRLTFLGLISMADDYGRVHDNVKIIDAFVFPNTDDSVRESLANLSRIVRINRGISSSGMPVIEIVNWEKHQRVDKPQPKLALPKIDSDGHKKPKKTAKNSIPELVANDSGIGRELVAPLTPTPTPTPTNDHGPTTMDHGAVTAIAVVAPDDVLSLWNAKMNQNCRMTDKRLASVRVRLKDASWVAAFSGAIDRAVASDFCNGRTPRTTWVADFEWFIKPDSVAKLVEGKFDNREQVLPLLATIAQQREANSDEAGKLWLEKMQRQEALKGHENAS
jgi:hypothetical protein